MVKLHYCNITEYYKHNRSTEKKECMSEQAAFYSETSALKYPEHEHVSTRCVSCQVLLSRTRPENTGVKKANSLLVS